MKSLLSSKEWREVIKYTRPAQVLVIARGLLEQPGLFTERDKASALALFAVAGW